jgi:hypothetical protein
LLRSPYQIFHCILENNNQLVARLEVRQGGGNNGNGGGSKGAVLRFDVETEAIGSVLKFVFVGLSLIT